MNQEMEFEAQRHQGKIFEAKVSEQRYSITNIGDIFHAEYLDSFQIEWRFLWLFLLILLHWHRLLYFLFFHFFLFLFFLAFLTFLLLSSLCSLLFLFLSLFLGLFLCLFFLFRNLLGNHCLELILLGFPLA